ncbi:MAG: MBOAT family protein, partial [Kangiellaceae bacterium]|nr:MBOAT family protein [Kangiellaceae bacterium]
MADSTSNSRRKFWLGLSLSTNLGILFFFEYFYFVSINVGHLLKLDIELESLILPLGISFYTLQTLGYTFDVYLKKVPPERHLGYFGLYVSFFPQLVAGPIE